MIKGDYVLATKYSDGDPKDQFAIGFYQGKTRHGRYLVEDENGQSFRSNGFRRCEKISERIGKVLVKASSTIEQGNASVWYWRYHPGQLLDVHKEVGGYQSWISNK